MDIKELEDVDSSALILELLNRDRNNLLDTTDSLFIQGGSAALNLMRVPDDGSTAMPVGKRVNFLIFGDAQNYVDEEEQELYRAYVAIEKVDKGEGL